jgi:hypothetical protein
MYFLQQISAHVSTVCADTVSVVRVPLAVEDLLLRTDVTRSAGVLGAATLLYILLEWSGVPVLTWLSNLALIAIAGTTLWAVGARVANM